jgi:hypothetical protein
LSSSSNGSPDQTIQEILSIVGNEMEDTTFQIISASTNQCEGPDPTEDIQILKEAIQDYIDNIWRQISKIDSVGRAEVIEKCGGDKVFTDMLTGAREIAKILTTIRRSLSSTVEAIGCESINSIYTQASHDIMCTETLSASVYGFITFLIMWICVMIMISLRASWLRNIEEEKVYHDETEVAENMVLDEHEEYLAYISRYKHEWQEYEGFEEEGATKSATTNIFNNELEDAESSGHTDSHHDADSSYYYGSEEFSCDAYESYDKPDRDEGISYDSGDEISFANISSEHNDGFHYVGKNEESESVPSQQQQPPLPPPFNPSFSDENERKVPSKAKVNRRRRTSASSVTSRKSLQSQVKVNSPFDFEPDFNHNFSHDLQPTDEVEVQLCI